MDDIPSFAQSSFHTYYEIQTGKGSRPLTPKGAVLPRRLLGLVPTPLKARPLLQISSITFGMKRGLLQGHGSRTEQVQVTVWNVPAQDMLKEHTSCGKYSRISPKRGLGNFKSLMNHHSRSLT
ncbi:uncharacterized protein M8220_004292 isoform 1-T11 [Acridotheres tristis]